jgi:hypothetical protein
MNKQIWSILVTGCLLALVIAVPARAQMPGTRMRVSIPFDFIVRGKILPAGNYDIKRISDSPQGLLMENVYKKHEQILFETEPVATREIPDRGEIVFHRYADSYFLSEVWTAGDETGQEVSPSRTERRLRREMASNGAEPESVAVAVY